MYTKLLDFNRSCINLRGGESGEARNGVNGACAVLSVPRRGRDDSGMMQNHGAAKGPLVEQIGMERGPLVHHYWDAT